MDSSFIFRASRSLPRGPGLGCDVLGTGLGAFPLCFTDDVVVTVFLWPDLCSCQGGFWNEGWMPCCRAADVLSVLRTLS